MMPSLQVLDGVVIAHHHTLEAPLAAQYFWQQPDIRAARVAVDLVVGRHDGADAGAGDDLFERREEEFAQSAFRVRRRPAIRAAFGLAMAGEMFQSCENLGGYQNPCISFTLHK